MFDTIKSICGSCKIKEINKGIVIDNNTIYFVDRVKNLTVAFDSDRSMESLVWILREKVFFELRKKVM